MAGYSFLETEFHREFGFCPWFIVEKVPDIGLSIDLRTSRNWAYPCVRQLLRQLIPPLFRSKTKRTEADEILMEARDLVRREADPILAAFFALSNLSR